MVERFDEVLRREQKRLDHEVAYVARGEDEPSPELFQRIGIEARCVSDWLGWHAIGTDSILIKNEAADIALHMSDRKRANPFLKRNIINAWQLEAFADENESEQCWLGERSSLYQNIDVISPGYAVVKEVHPDTSARTLHTIRAGLADLVIRHGLPRVRLIADIDTRVRQYKSATRVRR